MILNINFNPVGGAADIANVFILFRILSLSSGNYVDFKNGLFSYDNGVWDKFLCYTDKGELRVSGVSGRNTVNVTSSIIFPRQHFLAS